MIQAEYVKDMHNNYLVLKGIPESISGYHIKMLLNNKIKGMLKTELRCIDQMNLFYYDITSKKSLQTIYDSKFLNYQDVSSIMKDILSVIEFSREFLLSENDFVIQPEYVYLDNTSKEIRLCHFVGFNENIQEQLSRFIEYLMNKVDYKDEEAVLFVYALYKVSKENDCTFENLNAQLNKTFNTELKVKKINLNESVEIKAKEIVKKSSTEKESLKERTTSLDEAIRGTNHEKEATKKAMNKKAVNKKASAVDTKNQLESQYIKTEVKNESEILYYTTKTFIMAGITILAGIALMIGAYQIKLFHNPLKNQVDLIKLFSGILILGSMEIYIMTKLFHYNNRQTKMETQMEYINKNGSVDMIDNYFNDNGFGIQEEQNENTAYKNADEFFAFKDIDSLLSKDTPKKNKETYVNEEDLHKEEKSMDGETQLLWDDTVENDYDKTVLLSEIPPQKKYYIIPLEDYNLDHNTTKGIAVKNFPYHIGKSEKGNNHIIKDSSVSRMHGVITKEEDKVYLMDLNSTNGTYINGTKITENKPYLIIDSDELTFSSIHYIWREF